MQHVRECLLFIILFVFLYFFLVNNQRSNVLASELHCGHQQVCVEPEMTVIRYIFCETGLRLGWFFTHDKDMTF